MRKHIVLIISLLFLAASFFVAYFNLQGFGQSFSGNKMQLIFNRNLVATEKYINLIAGSSFEDAVKNTRAAQEKDISLIAFKNDNLVFWSDNNIPTSRLDLDSIIDGSLIQILNSKYYIIRRDVSDSVIIGFINLENFYPYKNQFLPRGLAPAYNIGHGEISSLSDTVNSFPIFNLNGEHVFNIRIKKEKTDERTMNHMLATLLLFMSFSLLLVYFRKILIDASISRIQIKIGVIIASLLVIRVMISVLPIFREHFYLFDPFIYATTLAPSFGELILNSMIYLFLIYLLYKLLKIPERFLSTQYNRNAWIGILNFVYLVVLYVAFHTSAGIINHSSFDVVLHDISQLSIPVVLSYLLFAAIFLPVLFVGLWLHNTLQSEAFYKLVINCSLIIVTVYLVSFPLQVEFDFITVVFGVVFYVVIGFIQKNKNRNAIFSSMLVLVILFSVHIQFFITRQTEIKDKHRNKSLAVSLSNEHDPIAEYLFEVNMKDMEKDVALQNLLHPDVFNIIELNEYLSQYYFSGYLKKYSVRITICRPSDSVLTEIPQFEWYPCYDYFKSYISDLGIQIPQTSFYYLDNYTGLISYLGWFKFNIKDVGEISMFLELDSKFTAEPIGYPELLLDERLQGGVRYEKISYAKYHLGKLISHSGKFDYSLRSKIFEKEGGNNFYSVKHNGYNHLVYRSDINSLIVISEQAANAPDMLVYFSYIFVFYYLLSLLTIFSVVSRYRNFSLNDSLRNKIQFYVLLVLVVSLIIIAGSTTLFNIKKYNQTQERILKEKIQSVYIELEHKLSFEQTLTSNWKSDNYDNLDQLLVKFSDVFYTDINLYSPNGSLLASSRPEIFQIGLQNKKMEPEAYFKMHTEKLAQYIHREKIKQLSYLSAYVPFVNVNGDLLAYLNLPYFTKQKELKDDVTTLTVAIINIYMILILISILVIVFISNQITKPLELLQNKFKELKLGENYERINYNRQDEIGRLVNEYNRMVAQLEHSVELLARSERESAWREMAKQVAHEIKNPLTPMRLSVQQLQRAWNDKNENFETYLNRVTTTLIEQIDNLSAIASEFSNFAKMPVAKIEDIELISIIEKAVSLYKDNENIKLNLEVPNDKIIIEADPEQLSRVFINIIKNGMQAIPDDRDGIINIKVRKHKHDVVIDFEDNGKGIPDEIKAKMFTPNFTTKSSGMGLGLAIVKNALNQIGGQISFVTKLGIGSTFSVKIPLKQA